jgi:RNA polymerase sigma factor, sigma-70 family
LSKDLLGDGYELEDLYQIGAMGFIKCIKRFDISFEVKLSTYAVPYILGEIKRFIRDDGLVKVSRSTKELGIKIIELQKDYMKKTGEEINVNQIAEILQIPKEEIALAMDCLNPVESIYGEQNSNEDKKISIFDKLSTNVDEASKIADKMAIKEMIEKLNDREREIILLRYYKEKTQTQVSKILGITQVQVSRIERKILEQMKSKLVS